MTLEPNATALPTLLTDCVLIGHAKKADVIFTPRQWFAICAHMMNENPVNFFLILFRDKNGEAIQKSFPRRREKADPVGLGHDDWQSEVSDIDWILSNKP